MTMQPLRVLFALLLCVLPALALAQNNPILASLAEEDQATRRGEPMGHTDEERVRAVLEQIAVLAVRTPTDQLNAALVLQHSPLTVRDGKVIAISRDNYLLAHLLAKAAFDGKHEGARHLVAQTLDRYLTFATGVQRYGTSRLTNQVTGVEELVPIDRETTDAERKIYGVPPLATLLKQFPEASRRP